MQCIIKQFFIWFVDIRITKVSVSVISLAFGSTDNTFLNLDNSEYQKTYPISVYYWLKMDFGLIFIFPYSSYLCIAQETKEWCFSMSNGTVLSMSTAMSGRI